jgi:hypothetical protein
VEREREEMEKEERRAWNNTGDDIQHDCMILCHAMPLPYYTIPVIDVTMDTTRIGYHVIMHMRCLIMTTKFVN